MPELATPSCADAGATSARARRHAEKRKSVCMPHRMPERRTESHRAPPDGRSARLERLCIRDRRVFVDVRDVRFLGLVLAGAQDEPLEPSEGRHPDGRALVERVAQRPPDRADEHADQTVLAIERLLIGALRRQEGGALRAEARIVRRGNAYKVREAEIIGFEMTTFLNTLFQNYISENGGNPRTLVIALNR